MPGKTPGQTRQSVRLTQIRGSSRSAARKEEREKLRQLFSRWFEEHPGWTEKDLADYCADPSNNLPSWAISVARELTS